MGGLQAAIVMVAASLLLAGCTVNISPSAPGSPPAPSSPNTSPGSANGPLPSPSPSPPASSVVEPKVRASFGAKAIDLPWSGTDTDNVDDAIEITLASADEDLQNTDITVSVDGLLLTWMSPYFLQGPTWAIGELCTSDPGLDGDAVWERGASVILIEGEAGADAGAAGCDTTPAAVANLGNMDAIHTIKVSVKGQVVLDTSVEVHDNAGS